jgi:hypothetical protein
MFTLVVTWPVSCFYVFWLLVSTEIVFQHCNVLSEYPGSWSSEKKTLNMISYKVKSHIRLIHFLFLYDFPPMCRLILLQLVWCMIENSLFVRWTYCQDLQKVLALVLKVL